MGMEVIIFIVLCLCSARGQDVNQRYYPRYHLAPPYGWMNDPNGFSKFNNEYHLFYQYNPVSSLEPGYAHWGHAKSSNLISWEHLPIALYPDKTYDANGVFSGSAIVENGTMYAYYTSNLNHAGETPDHEQHQCLATSTDGINFVKNENNPIIPNTDLQPHIRDPKVWKNGDTYYMVLGNSISDQIGRVLLFSSTDKLSWQQVSELDRSNGSLGFMWECPDFFELNGKFVLLFSPQGITAQGDKYKNLYQTGYIVGSFDYTTNKFTPETEFRELDNGHDFYATQTIDDGGKRVVIAWFDMWEQYYPERQDGFTGFMTLPRTLTLTSEGRLLQNPVAAVTLARGHLLFCGPAGAGKYVRLQDKAGSITIKAATTQPLILLVKTEGSTATVTISYDPNQGTVTLDRGGTDGVRRTQWTPTGTQLYWRLFVDASSVELFCGQGEVTFSSRFFPDGQVSVGVLSGKAQQMTVRSVRRTVPFGGKN